MKWHGRNIQLFKNPYNCSINDPSLQPQLPILCNVYIVFTDGIRRLLGQKIDKSVSKTIERSIEIPLALDFINYAIPGEPFVELGCVLPYYIFTEPNHKVYDLMDPHPDNEKKDIRFLSDDELSTNILSISTVEHISQSEYGIPENSTSGLDVVKKIISCAQKFFVTFPLGHNSMLDKYVLEENVPFSTFITRRHDNQMDWRIVERSELTSEMVAYGTYCCANTICVLTNYDN